MKTYLIAYDLNKPGQDYGALFAAIKSLTKTWWHNLDSAWIVRHPGTAVDICNALSRFMDRNDELLVVQLSGEGAWTGFDAEASTWLKNNL